MINRDGTSGPPDFRIGRRLGQGRHADVHHAVHTSSGANIALKRWNVPTGELSPEQRHAFVAECTLMRRLCAVDPRIVRYQWSGMPAEGQPWLAMDLFECSLAERVAAGRLDLLELLDVADDLLAGLAAIHRAGYVHRDVDPSNVLLRGRVAALADLGHAVQFRTPCPGPAPGDKGFVAPEVAEGGIPDARTDVFAAARTIAAAAPASVPDWLGRLLATAGSLTPRDRPADAAAFRQSLTAARATAGLPARDGTRAVVGGRRFPHLRRRHGVLAGLASVILITGSGIGIALTWAASPLGERHPLASAEAAATAPATAPVVAPSAAPAAAPVPAPSSTVSVPFSPSTTPSILQRSTPAPRPVALRTTAPSPSPTPSSSPSSTTPVPPTSTSPTSSPSTPAVVVWPAGVVCEYEESAAQTVHPAAGVTPADPQLDKVFTYGFTVDSHMSVGLTGDFAGPAPTGGRLQYFVRFDPATVGQDGNAGNGRVYPSSVITPDAQGCSFDQLEQVGADDGVVGIRLRFYVAFVPDADAAAVDAASAEDGWASADDLPTGVRRLSWFDLDTSGFGPWAP